MAALKVKEITWEIKNDAVCARLTTLYNMAVKKATKAGFKITTVAISFSNFLCKKVEGGFDCFVNYVLSLACLIWGPKIKFEHGSKAQCAAMYICERFKDSLAFLK